ncbi:MULTISPECIES: hypothetical protein [Nocardia]|uniref:hypothetical protein n=1 Tax=Nocardia TaxID=1817 RepID=UPI002456F022|nr:MULTISPECIES: hypothetical protein [Nocardia]
MTPDDRRSVRPFQVIVFLGYMAAGIDAAVKGAPPGAVSQAMGNRFAVVWIVMLIVFPAVSLLGLAARRWAGGPWMQLSGNLGVGAASAAYVLAVLQATWAERASFAAWVTASLTVCAVGLVYGDVRWIVAVTRRMREMDNEGD